MTIPFDLIVRLLDQMPRWVKIILVFISTALAIWIVVSPRLIIGQVIARPAPDQVIPLRGLDMQLAVMGHVHKFRVNEDGYWVVPLASAYPLETLTIRIDLKDGKPLREFAIDVADMWVHDLVTVEVVYAEGQETSVRVVHSGVADRISSYASLFFGEAWAGELKLPKEVGGVTVGNATAQNTDIINNEVNAIVLNQSAYREEEVSTTAEATSFGNLNYIGKVLTINQVEKQFSVPIPDEHWQHFEDTSDIADYIAKRRSLEKALPASGMAKNLTDWSKAIETLPSKEQPVFQRSKN